MKNEKLSSIGQRNLDWLIGMLKQRLQSSAKAKSADTNGNVIYVDTDIFAKETLEAFVNLSLSDFNQTPYFTSFSFEDSNVIDTFADILVEGAVLYCLSSKALVERGREFTFVDNGIMMDPPAVSDMLNTQFSTLLQYHWEKLKTIKNRITEFKK